MEYLGVLQVYNKNAKEKLANARSPNFRRKWFAGWDGNVCASCAERDLLLRPKEMHWQFGLATNVKLAMKQIQLW